VTAGKKKKNTMTAKEGLPLSKPSSQDDTTAERSELAARSSHHALVKTFAYSSSLQQEGEKCSLVASHVEFARTAAAAESEIAMPALWDLLVPSSMKRGVCPTCC